MRPNWIKAGAVAAGCAAVGAVAGIAGSAAAPSSKAPSSKAPPWRMEKRMHAGPMRGAFGGPPVHAEAVVPKRSGSGFETVTEDNGKLKSRSGNDVTITEGTQTQTYKDVTITVPSGATIYRNGAKASLDALKDGDFVRVAQSPEGTFVMARDASFRPRFEGRHRGFERGPGGPGGPPPPYGP
ncbi:MAG: hypothetical protein QOF37_2775 [Thermoleophilaceae bacterium]|jgi:hypothetical protein|nr:hypothetical protein [Thermoleophilaceae bacterium]